MVVTFYVRYVDGLINIMILQQFNKDPIVQVQSVRPEHSEKALFHLCDEVNKRTKGKCLDLLFAILPDNNGPLYGMYCFRFQYSYLIVDLILEMSQDIHKVVSACSPFSLNSVHNS